jgi:DNA mismatch endonuclease (patch repair protein)
MPDIFEPEKRSEIMRHIKSKNSKAELYVFRELRRRGIYFQKHYRHAPGTPDLALPRKRLAVFIDGDFWHGRTFEGLRMRRPDPEDFWVKKIQRNMNRDARQEAELSAMGWKVLRVWDSDLNRKRTAESTLEKIVIFLKNEK